MNRYLNQLSNHTLRYVIVAVCLFSLTWASTAEAQFFRSPFYGVGVPRAYRPIPSPVYRPSFVAPIPPIPRSRGPYVAVPVPVPGAVLQRRAYSYPYASSYPYATAYPRPTYRYGYGLSPYSSFSLRVDTGPGYAPRSYRASSYGPYAVPVPLPSISITRPDANTAVYDGTIQVSAETEFGVGNFGPATSDINSSLSPIPNTTNAGDITQRLHAAATRLEQSLGRRGDDSEVWQDYLAPSKIISMLHNGTKRTEFGEILKNFDGVAANTDLRNIANVDGFAETRKWLREFVGDPREDDLGESVMDSDPVSNGLETRSSSTQSPVASELPTPIPLPDLEPTGPTLAAPIAPADSGDSE